MMPHPLSRKAPRGRSASITMHQNRSMIGAHPWPSTVGPRRATRTPATYEQEARGSGSLLPRASVAVNSSIPGRQRRSNDREARFNLGLESVAVGAGVIGRWQREWA